MMQGLGIALFWLLFTISLAAQCPTVKVIGPKVITAPGDDMVFRAEVGVMGPKLEYSWSIDKGTIIDGQGTPAITVLADPSLVGKSVTATVQVSGLPSSCNGFSSATAGIANIICALSLVDSWTKLKPNDTRARLDSFFIGLIQNPEHVGFIQLLVTPEEKFDSSNSRVQFILNHARFRKVDKQRLWFVLEIAEDPKTSLSVIKPEGETEIPCDRCLIIKGEHL
jgi:hypothetical protein